MLKDAVNNQHSCDPLQYVLWQLLSLCHPAIEVPHEPETHIGCMMLVQNYYSNNENLHSVKIGNLVSSLELEV